MALEILVTSPGKDGEMPWALRFSSSTSEGYSVVISLSRRSIGVPVAADVNLYLSATGLKRKLRPGHTYPGRIGTRKPSSGFQNQRSTECDTCGLDGDQADDTCLPQHLYAEPDWCSRLEASNIAEPEFDIGSWKS